MLRIYLMGSFRVECDGVIIPESAWTRRKAKNLLKLLVLRPAHQLHKEQVIELLWPDLDLTAALNNFYRTLHILRNCLEPNLKRVSQSSFLTLRDDLIRLGEGADIWVDLENFEALVSQARSASDPVLLLEEAIRLYRGELLEEDLYEEWTQAPRQNLRRVYIEALLKLAMAYSQRRAYDAAAASLQRLLETEPAHEPAHQQLMLIYALSGRSTDSLAQYQQCLKALDAELAQTPSAATTELYRRILAGEFKAPSPLPASNPVPLASVTPASAPAYNNLPVPLTPLIGRQNEVALAMRLLQDPQVRLLTMLGPGGTGKTRLGLQVAAELQPCFKDGVYFVSLAPLSDPALVIPAIAQVIGLPEINSHVQPQLETLKNFLHSRQVLLVLDNFEQVLDAAPQVAALVEAAAALKVLVTSRAALRIYGEYEMGVPPLALPDFKNVPTLEKLQSYPAITLFVQRCQAVKPDFALTSENSQAVLEICARLDGLPLALELAATRIKLLTPQAMTARLGDGRTDQSRLDLLKGGARNLPDRQKTLRDTIAWSFNLLDQPEQQLFARLGAFVGGFNLEAAQAVCLDNSSAGSELDFMFLDLLTSLVDKSLLRQEDSTDGATRFGMLETIRDYAVERLELRGELGQLRRKHACYFLGLVEQAEKELMGPRQGEWLDMLEPQLPNLRLAMEWSIRNTVEGRFEQNTGDCSQLLPLEIGLRTAGALEMLWEVRGYLSEGRDTLEGLLARAGVEIAPRARVRALLAAGRLAYLQGDYEAARPIYQQSLALQEQLEDQTGAAKSLGSLGIIALRQSSYDNARSYFRKSLEIYEATTNHPGLADTLNSLGLANWFQGEYNAARADYERSLGYWELTREKRGIAITLSNVGAVASQQGDYEVAKFRQEEALAIWQELGDRWGQAHALQHLGVLSYSQGDYATARRLHEHSLHLRRDLGDRWGQARSLSNLGLVTARDTGYAPALAQLQESLSLRQKLGERWGQTESLINLAQVSFRYHHYDAASQYYREGLILAGQLGIKFQLASALEGLGNLEARAGRNERAARLWSAAQDQREAIGAIILPCDKAEYDERVAQARYALGDRSFAVAWEAGRTLPLEQVTALALELEPAPELEAAPAVVMVAPAAPARPGSEKTGIYLNTLTAREVEVLRSVAQGLSNAQVAEKLIITPRTVNVHLTSIYSKLNVNSRTAAARIALECHLV